MKGTEVRFGIIGAGTIAAFHARAIQAVEGARLTAVFDTVEERSRDFAAKHGIKSYTNLDEFLHDAPIDAVTVATPTGLHGASRYPQPLQASTYSVRNHWIPLRKRLRLSSMPVAREGSFSRRYSNTASAKAPWQ